MLESTGMLSNERGTHYYSKDESAGIRQVENDRDNDGTIDAISTFYEDKDGKTVKGLYDYDGDGKYDSVSIFDYNDDGKLKTRYDGTVEYKYSLNKQGEYKDMNFDGLIDEKDQVKHENFDSYVNFSYDEEGNMSQTESKELTGWNKFIAKKKSINIEIASDTNKQLDIARRQRKTSHDNNASQTESKESTDWNKLTERKQAIDSEMASIVSEQIDIAQKQRNTAQEYRK